MTDDRPVTRALDAQGELQPGQQGYWRVHGAMPADIMAGDLVMVKGRDDDEISEYEVTEIIPQSGILDAMYVRFKSAAGDDRSLGRLCPIILLRKGTCGTLADSVR